MHVDETKVDPRDVYKRRFDVDAEFRRGMWGVLCRDYFQRFVRPDDTVVEVAAGYCEFINHIKAGRKIALDINEETKRHAGKDVEVILTPSTDLHAIADATAHVVFMSNFLEHISKPDIVSTLKECKRILKPGGRIIILQPSIRNNPRDYWMFFDHVTALDDRSLSEILEVLGYRIELCLARFLPYTTKSRYPRALWLIQLYLRIPLLWRLLGGQCLVVATR